jgi:hypothetical protein
MPPREGAPPPAVASASAGVTVGTSPQRRLLLMARPPGLRGVTGQARSGTVAVGERGGITILTRGSREHGPSLALEKRKSRA